MHKHKGLYAKDALTDIDVLQLREDMGADPVTQIDYVHIISQCHGDMIMIPPGWLHQVVNKLPCIKLAWDFYTLEGLVKYVSSWQHIGQPLMRDKASADYTNFMGVALKVLEKLPCAAGCRCQESCEHEKV